MLSTRLSATAFLAAYFCLASDAALNYNVACHGQNNILNCPEGFGIHIKTLEYGETSKDTCTATDKPALKVSAEKCFHPAMMPWASLVCNNWEHCRLPKPNRKMFVCDVDMKKTFIQIPYECVPKQPGTKTITTCDGKNAKISCSGGSKIRIVKANYGRLDDHTCTKEKSIMTFCVSYHVAVVTQTCDGKTECEIAVNEGTLGKGWHCDNLPKYLRVDYVCEK